MVKETPDSSMPVPDPTKLTTEAVDRATDALKELFGGKFDNLSDAIDRLREEIDARPAQVIQELEHLRELMMEKFEGVNRELAGRVDITSQQNAANAVASNKAEAAIAKQIDSIVDLLRTQTKASDEKIDDIKVRVGAIENKKKGSDSNWGALLGGAGVVIAVITAFIAVMAIATRQDPTPPAPIVIERPAP